MAHHGTDGQRANLVSLAGLDGAGKTTQARLLGEWLTARGQLAAVEAPDGPSFIRSALNGLAADLGVTDHHAVFGPDTTHLITAFMRYRDWAERVIPALGTHRWVITDRSAVCHYAAAYAVGATNEAALRMVLKRLPAPDLTVYLDVPPREAFLRLTQRSVGQEETAFLVANERGYRQLPEFAGFAVVDGRGSVSQVHARVRQAVGERFGTTLTASHGPEPAATA